MRRILLVSLITLATISSAQALDFFNAKKALRQLYYNASYGRFENANRTIYCNCRIKYDGRKMVGPDLTSCDFESKGNNIRADRIEWEHIMPAWVFGHQLQCWQEGGRHNCQETNDKFNKMEGDMHNLFPVIGEVNEARANYRFAEWLSKKSDTRFGKCQMIIDFKERKVQPPKSKRGTIARAYLYMADKYQIKLTDQDLKTFQVWKKQNLPTKWECFRNIKIAEIQGNDNPYITEQCKNPDYKPN